MDTLIPEFVTVGIDIGQRHDPTAIAVAEAIARPTGRVDHGRCRYVEPRAPLRPCDEYCTREYGAFYRVRLLERLPLDTRYQDVADRVAALGANLELRVVQEGYGRIPLYVLADETGVGNPVVELIRSGLQDTAIRVTGVTFTGTSTKKVGKGSRRGTVGKEYAVNHLVALFETERIALAAGAVDAATMRKELGDFQRKQKRQNSDHLSFEARTGAHDDLVSALALAVLHDPVGDRVRTVPLPEAWGG